MLNNLLDNSDVFYEVYLNLLIDLARSNTDINHWGCFMDL